MTDYTVYNSFTGAILRTIAVSPEDLSLNLKEGEEVIVGKWRNDEWYVAAGELVAVPPRPSSLAVFDAATGAWGVDADAELQCARQEAKKAINALVDGARAVWVTNLLGQDMVYAAKRAEAAAWLAADPPPADLSAFPWIAAEVGITAPTAAELAQIWLNLDALWQAEGARIEALRQAALTTIAAAETAGDITTAVETARAAL